MCFRASVLAGTSCLKSRVCHPATCISHSPKVLELLYFMVATAKVAIIILPITSAFFANSRCNHVSHLFDSYKACVKNLILILSSNVLANLHPTMSLFQQMSETFKPPTRTTGCEPDTSSDCLKALSTSLWSSGHLSQIMTHKLSTCHLSHRRAPYVRTASSLRGKLPESSPSLPICPEDDRWEKNHPHLPTIAPQSCMLSLQQSHSHYRTCGVSSHLVSQAACVSVRVREVSLAVLM